MKLYNTLTRSVEEFTKPEGETVSLYTCGITAYDYSHIGHARKYIGDDILKRVLVANGYKVKHVQNVTDVGHLTSDEDEGDDKLEKGAKEKNMTVWEIAKFFEEYFYKSMDEVNNLRPDIICRATEHIAEQIKLIQKLEQNGFTYQTEEAIYFDVSKFPDYGKLAGQKLEDKTVGAREEVKVDSKKKNPQDFVLWFFTVGHFENHTMRWPSPWGEGFPGWHIECSAMSMQYLGDTIDIHTGGIDHIPVHHPNEIAQSEAATGKKFVNYWIHHEHLMVDGEKMSKSKKNFYTIEQIKEKGFDPLALRYLFLTAHYRDHMNFTWESLQAAQNALNNLRETVRDWNSPESREVAGDSSYYTMFLECLNHDLSTATALAQLWELVKADISTGQKAHDLLRMDKILGLKLDEYVAKQIEVPGEVQKLVDEREKARTEKDFAKSDQLRDEIKKLGYEVLDTANGPKINKV